MNILPANKTNILNSSKIIRSGGLVAFPTETVYGLGANGLDAKAVAKIFAAKERPSFNPLILHISNKADITKIAEVENDVVFDIISNFWPGPLTLVLKKKSHVPDIVTAGHPTVAIRMPDHPVALELIRESKVPIAAPSANKFGQLSPTDAKHVEKQLGNRTDIILDGGKCKVGIESTILLSEGKEFRLLRHGGLSIAELEKYTGTLEKKTEISETPVAPGMLAYHYSPSVPVNFIDDAKSGEIDKTKHGIMCFNCGDKYRAFSKVKILSREGNYFEAAANLFSILHEFEEEKVGHIWVEKIPEEGLGIAIMDRLKKATKKYEKA